MSPWQLPMLECVYKISDEVICMPCIKMTRTNNYIFNKKTLDKENIWNCVTVITEMIQLLIIDLDEHYYTVVLLFGQEVLSEAREHKMVSVESFLW